MSIKGFPFIGKLKEKLWDSYYYATVNKVGHSKAALDVVHRGFYLLNPVPTTPYIVEAGSDDNLVVLTGHPCRAGDVLRVRSSVNNIQEYEIHIDEVVDANSFKLAGYLSSSLVAGDTVDLLRPVMERFDSTGATLASVTMPPVKIQKVAGGITTEPYVTKNLDTPANSEAMPVILYGASGTLSVTSETIDINLSHAGTQQDSVAIGNGNAGSPKFWDIDSVNGAGLVRAVDLDIRDLAHTQDSVKVGDGTRFISINASNETLTHDPTVANRIGATNDTAETDHTATGTMIAFLKGAVSRLTSISGKLPAALGATTKAGSLSVTLATDTGNLPVSATDLDIRAIDHSSDSIRLGDGTTIAGVDSSTNALKIKEVSPITGFATSALQGDTNTKLDTVIGHVDGLETLIGATNTAIGATNTAIASTNTKLDSVIASVASSNIGVMHFARLTAVNGSAGAFIELTASATRAVRKIKIVEDVGAFLGIYVGGSGSEALVCIIALSGEMEFDASQIPAGSRVTIRSMDVANITASNIVYHLLG